MDFVPAEKGVPIRQPSTANLMLDSADRTNLANFPDYSARFQIQKNNSIMNGFFTRIGTTECVLEWYTPNISAALGNDTLTVDLSGATPGGGTATSNTPVPDGFYTVAEALQYLTGRLNAAGATLTPAITFTVSAWGQGPGAVITPSAAVYIGLNGTFADALNIGGLPLTEFTPTEELLVNELADLRPLRYLDFVSQQLTYNQELKDSSTAPIVRDVLLRWYFAWDQPPFLDAFGFPILMGYTPFVLRRTFSPPKQIRWDPKQPLGNVSFEVYKDDGTLLQPNSKTNWLMTLQVSEV